MCVNRTTVNRTTMVRMNAYQDPRELAATYAQMSDDELLDLNADFAALTETAQSALRTEIQSRRLQIPAAPQAEATRISFNSGAETRSGATGENALRQYYDPAEAMDRCDLLKANGFAARVEIAKLPAQDAYSAAPNVYRLFVPDSEFVDAGNFVSEKEQEEMPPPESSEYDGPQCPRCHSGDVGVDSDPAEELDQSLGGSRPTGKGAAPMEQPSADMKWQCMACGFTWREQE